MAFFGLWGANGAPQSNGYGSTKPADAPGVSRGIVSRLRSLFPPYPGPKLAHDHAPKVRDYLAGEKTAGQPHGLVLPQFLPWLDNFTDETAGIRRAYRLMWRHHGVKAAILGKILAVAGLDLKVLPADKKNPIDKATADYVSWGLTRRLRDGVPGLVWSILSGGCTDGYSVSEKVWGYQTRGKHEGKWVLRALKPQTVGEDLVLQTDEHKNVVGLQGLRFNAGVEMSPADYIIYRHLPLYNSPTGMSDFRAAYMPFFMYDTVIKLRAIHLDRKAVPVLGGEYADPTQQQALNAALQQVRSRNWFSVPKDTRLQALDIAGSADAMFNSALTQLLEDIFLAIQGATLQALTGGENEQRGSSQVHKTTTQLLTWHLREAILSLLNDEENGLIKDMVDLNFLVSEYPRATFSAVEVEDMKAQADLLKTLLDCGLPVSLEGTYEAFDQSPPKGPDDVLKPPQPPQQSPGAGGPPKAFADAVTALTAQTRRLRRFAEGTEHDPSTGQFTGLGKGGKKSAAPKKIKPAAVASKITGHLTEGDTAAAVKAWQAVPKGQRSAVLGNIPPAEQKKLLAASMASKGQGAPPVAHTPVTVAALAHDAGRGIADPITGKTNPGNLPEHESHKPFIADVYRDLKGKGKLGDVSLDEFKRHLLNANAQGHTRLSRLDFVQGVKPQGGKSGVERVEESSVKHPNGEFHTINTNSDVARKKPTAHEAFAERTLRLAQDWREYLTAVTPARFAEQDATSASCTDAASESVGNVSNSAAADTVADARRAIREALHGPAAGG